MLLAMRTGSWELMKYLLDRPETIFDPTNENSSNVEVLFYSIKENRKNEFKKLVDYIETKFNQEKFLQVLNSPLAGYSLLHYALTIDDDYYANHLISVGADVNLAIQKNGIRPIHIASGLSDTDKLQLLLLNTKIDIGAKTTDKGLSALHFTALKKQKRAMELLLNDRNKKYFNINEPSKSGITPLGFAVLNFKNGSNDDQEIVRILLDNGADVTAEDQNRNSVISIAVGMGKIDVVKVFLEGQRQEILESFEANGVLPGMAYLFSLDNYVRPIGIALNNQDEISRNEMASYLFFLFENKVKKAISAAYELSEEEKAQLFESMSEHLNNAESIEQSLNNLSVTKNEVGYNVLQMFVNKDLKWVLIEELLIILNSVLYQLSEKQINSIFNTDEESLLKLLQDQNDGGESVIHRIVREKSVQKNIEALALRIAREFVLIWTTIPVDLQKNLVEFHQSWKKYPVISAHPEINWHSAMEKMHNFVSMGKNVLIEKPEMLKRLRYLFDKREKASESENIVIIHSSNKGNNNNNNA
ncbi:MAG: ankyrin repeat domain-containing protein [Myxococcales bacterium]|nr:MAG: ankyrin repeat domain-containing protein [Myxococcales bacterium]